MQRQLKKTLGSLWAENLHRARLISYCFVVTNRRIVLKTGLVEDLRRRIIETQPMYPNAQVRPLGCFHEPAMFLATLLHTVPGVNSMDRNFVAHMHQVLQQGPLFIHVVRCRPPLGMTPLHLVAGAILKRYEEECCL